MMLMAIVIMAVITIVYHSIDDLVILKVMTIGSVLMMTVVMNLLNITSQRLAWG